MGISVISTASAAAAATSASASSTTATEGIPGDFATLLLGELKSLLPSPSADTPLTSAETQDSLTATGIVDPAVIAAMLGNAQQPPVKNTISADGIVQTDEPSAGGITEALSATAKDGGKSISGASQALARADGKQLTENDQQAKDFAETIADLGKSTQARNLAPGLNRQQAGEAANIAVQAAPPETVPAALPSQASAVATGRAAQEAPAEPPGIAAHLHESAWPKQFGDRVVWMAKADQQSAQININPPQLGPVQITLNLSGDQASLAFASPHAEVRQAIESALPQLKEMLASAGINLGQSNVGANLGRQTPETPFQDANGNRSANENAILPANDKAANIAGSAVLHRGRGMVDLFA